MPEPKPPTLEELQAQLTAANAAAEAARDEAARANGEKMMARATLDAVQATQDLLDAKRQLAAGNDDDQVTEHDMVSEIRQTNELLRAQRKFMVELYLRPEDEGKNLFEVVQINGANIFQIERGVPVEVPESIYQVLVASHLRVRPQRREDNRLVMPIERPGMFGQRLNVDSPADS
jgi:hypothetical protein